MRYKVCTVQESLDSIQTCARIEYHHFTES